MIRPPKNTQARRKELLDSERWLVESAVPGSVAALRQQELLRVWNGHEYLCPQFQFDTRTGSLMPEMKTLLSILPNDRTGWRQAFWLFQRHGALSGGRPADVFQLSPNTVIQAARGDFEVSDDRW